MFSVADAAADVGADGVVAVVAVVIRPFGSKPSDAADFIDYLIISSYLTVNTMHQHHCHCQRLAFVLMQTLYF